jgi:aryl-alcohol dehydrogenase-like predicted oxidoreductase
MNFGRPTPEDESLEIIDYALDNGINFFDTADIYSRGLSEEIVGRALKRNGKRDHIVLATKVHNRMDDNEILSSGNNRRHIIEGCEASLRRLQTDYIDLYQIHRPQSSVPIDETIRALDDLIRAGKVRYIGTSSFAAWQVMESLWVSRELGLNRFVSEQPPYHLLDRSIERDLVPLAQAYGLAILPWSPLARGFLSGKYRRGEEIPSDSRVASDMQGPFAARTKKHFSDLAFGVIDQLEEIAREKGCTVAQIALAWCMNQPGVTSPIVGPRTMEHLKDNLGAAEVTLTDEDRARLNAVVEPEQVIVSYYNGKAMDFKASPYRW